MTSEASGHSGDVDDGDFSCGLFKNIKDSAWLEHDVLKIKLADPAKGPLRSFLNVAARCIAYAKHHDMKDPEGNLIPTSVG